MGASYVNGMTEPGTGARVRDLSRWVLAPVRWLVPSRFRSDRPLVPVVRLAGVIGISTPLRPGLTLAGVARSLDRAFAMRNARAVALVDQFAGRIAGAVASDLPPHPRAGRARRSAG